MSRDREVLKKGSVVLNILKSERPLANCTLQDETMVKYHDYSWRPGVLWSSSSAVVAGNATCLHVHWAPSLGFRRIHHFSLPGRAFLCDRRTQACRCCYCCLAVFCNLHGKGNHFQNNEQQQHEPNPSHKACQLLCPDCWRNATYYVDILCMMYYAL